MKLSSILASGFLLSGIIASPIAASSDVTESSFTSTDNSTDINAAGSEKLPLCFDANKSVFCHGNSYRACYAFLSRPGVSPKDAKSQCSFWCSKIKTVDECKSLKKKFDFHPKFSCDKDAKYC
ncbi:putative secreted protein [Wickerhamomyces ciferrii]|uniref:Secreted protein n=1 Tax=Wickerhamomyces ciferrii (strain ATCC 14091 / BCRC 22168 / CBS 111 / JCM 3599 / NBRC 0793 / NRRL Y-1031 F-60-10) TaxID=1206466 RepID=K0KWW4_WICCF|nr:uncharacterized protein BN7_6130 [Wickerhamomyces ciferrii]CCH46537.1 putative secreted protein [Wickerhamomyces ciferrii]